MHVFARSTRTGETVRNAIDVGRLPSRTAAIDMRDIQFYVFFDIRIREIQHRVLLRIIKNTYQKRLWVFPNGVLGFCHPERPLNKQSGVAFLYIPTLNTVKMVPKSLTPG